MVILQEIKGKYNMNNKLLHQNLQQLSGNVYETGEYDIPWGWTKLKSYDIDNGFQANVYINGNDIAVVYRGTEINKRNENIKDIKTDVQMGLGLSPNQYTNADSVYKEIKKTYPNSEITVSGHSLGGSLAQLVSATNGCPAVTFNAYGTGEILSNMGIQNQKLLNIINYGNPDDAVFGMKYNKQPGRTFITDNNLNPENKYLINKSGHYKIPDIEKHKLDKLNLENAVEVEPTNFYDLKQKTPLLKTSISYDKIFTPNEIGKMTTKEFAQNEQAIMEQLRNGQIKAELPKTDYKTFKNPETGTNKIYTRDDISKMSTDDYAKNEKEILAQMNSIGIPYKNDLPRGTQTHSDTKEKSSRSKSNSSSGNSGDGKWVTINGNHVLIEK